MPREDEWRVADLLDSKEPFANDVKLARQMVDTLEKLDYLEQNHSINPITGSSGYSLNIRTPKAALEFIENTLSDWFETVAEIEKKRGNMPYLIDRSLYEPGKIDWNQGLTFQDIHAWLGEDPVRGDGMHKMAGYGFRKIDKSAKSGEPLSGYFNRLLPVKFVLRVMTMLTLNSEVYDKEEGWDEEYDDTISLSELRDKSWQTATYAKEELERLEKALGCEKDSRISVGFPSKSAKSKERFVAQFVGSLRKNKLSGALFEMGFANTTGMIGMKLDDVRFTVEGFNFAQLENPIIDESENWGNLMDMSSTRFSDQEVEFLIGHFKKNVPAEWEFMLQIGNMIREGVNRAVPMNAKLITERGWERTKASIMRTGVIARMQELGLVNREKSGVEVTFVLTESGDRILSE